MTSDFGLCAMTGNNSADPFGSTRWSIVLAAGADGTSARAALETLCVAYWLPVYGFVRSKVGNTHDAHDLTQAFFADVLERNTISAADPARGRFRAFLLTSLRHFLINQHARATTKKRGGGQKIESIDHDEVEMRLSAACSRTRTPEQEFERRWALALLDRVLQRLEQEQEMSGRSREFSALRPFLMGGQTRISQPEVARSLQLTPEAVRSAVYRLRKRYRQLLQDEVSQTVASPEDVDDELQRLIAAVGR